MDLVYILGTGSRWNNREIRYSLRSVEKYLQGFDRVWVVGERPDFLKNIIHVPCSDPTDRHEFNIMRKIETFCQLREGSERFFFINDDHFLLEHAQCNGYPFYSKGGIMDSALKRDEDRYFHALQNTYHALAERGLTTFNFDVHTPIVYDKKKFIEVMNLYDWRNNEYVIKSLYCNTLKIKPVEITDCKINARDTLKGIIEKTTGKTVFTIGDIAIRHPHRHLYKPKVHLFLQQRYPNKSKYEQ
jgi:hypothetical protein